MCPIISDPKARFDVVLETDREKAEPIRPTFTFRTLTSREFRAAVTVADAIDGSSGEKAPSGVEMFDSILRTIKTALVDWRNMDDAEQVPVLYDPDRLEDIVSMQEANELLTKLMTSGRPMPIDLKKSGSQPPSVTELFAGVVGQATAQTKTADGDMADPADSSPPASSAPSAPVPDVPTAAIAGASS